MYYKNDISQGLLRSLGIDLHCRSWQFSVNIFVFGGRLPVSVLSINIEAIWRVFIIFLKLENAALVMYDSKWSKMSGDCLKKCFFSPCLDTFLLFFLFFFLLCVCVCVCKVSNMRRGYGNGSRGGREGPDGPAMKSTWACLYQLQLSLGLQWNWSTPETPKSRRRPTHNIVLNGTKKINTQCKWKAGSRIHSVCIFPVKYTFWPAEHRAWRNSVLLKITDDLLLWAPICLPGTICDMLV